MKKYPWLSLRAVEAAVPAMEASGAAAVARGAKASTVTREGFVEAYRAVGGKPARMQTRIARGTESWARRRTNFIKRHMAQVKANKESLFSNGVPTARLLGLIAWAYVPPAAEKRVARWYDAGAPGVQKERKMRRNGKAYERFEKAAHMVGGDALLQVLKSAGSFGAWFIVGDVGDGETMLLYIDDEEGDGLLIAGTVLVPDSVHKAKRPGSDWWKKTDYSASRQSKKFVLASTSTILTVSAKGTSVKGYTTAMRKLIKASLKKAHLKRHGVAKFR